MPAPKTPVRHNAESLRLIGEQLILAGNTINQAAGQLAEGETLDVCNAKMWLSDGQTFLRNFVAGVTEAASAKAIRARWPAWRITQPPARDP